MIKFKDNEENSAKQVAMQTVIIAETNIDEGTTLTREHIEARKIPVKYYAPNSIIAEDWRKIIGLKTTRPIQKGHQLSYSDIPQLSQHLADDIPKGLRAFTITVNDNSSQSGQIQPSDNIDIISLSLNNKEPSSKTILQNIKVIAVGGQRIDHDLNTHYSNITILLNPEQCQRLALAQVLGQLTLTLRSPDDTDPSNVTPTYESDLGKTIIKIKR